MSFVVIFLWAFFAVFVAMATAIEHVFDDGVRSREEEHFCVVMCALGWPAMAVWWLAARGAPGLGRFFVGISRGARQYFSRRRDAAAVEREPIPRATANEDRT